MQFLMQLIQLQKIEALKIQACIDQHCLFYYII